MSRTLALLTGCIVAASLAALPVLAAKPKLDRKTGHLNVVAPHVSSGNAIRTD